MKAFYPTEKVITFESSKMSFTCNLAKTGFLRPGDLCTNNSNTNNKCIYELAIHYI